MVSVKYPVLRTQDKQEETFPLACAPLVLLVALMCLLRRRPNSPGFRGAGAVNG
jgi:hypothetical protein